jgi:flagellar biosynthesis chaperone FliJ
MPMGLLASLLLLSTTTKCLRSAISKYKAEELLEVMRNGMDMQRERYYQPQISSIHKQIQQPTKTMTNNNQEPYQLLMNWLSLLNSKNKE